MMKALFKWHPVMTDKQYTVFKWWSSEKYKDYEGIIADGSIRSGKTESMDYSFVLWAMETFDGMDFAMCGKTVGALRRNVTNKLKRKINQRRGWRAEERRADNLIIVTYKGRSNNFYLFGGKDESSQDLIQGMTLAGVFFDEVALMPESFVNQATARCSVDGSKWWFNCNPGSPQHWFKKNWINKAREKKLLYLHFTMDDNPSLSEKIKERYAKQYTGVFYRRFILGLWCIAEGIIYDMFRRERHVTNEPPMCEGDIYVSSDYGIQNPNVWLVWQRIKGTNRWYQMAESVYSGKEKGVQKTVQELADDLDALMAGNKPKAVIIDPSATAMKAELRKRKYKIISADNDVIDGIADVQTMLASDRILVNASCVNTIKEYETYVWDAKASERGEDKPVKKFDHCMDAQRYFVRTMKLVKRDKAPSRTHYYME